jgi:hypothetical protein
MMGSKYFMSYTTSMQYLNNNINICVLHFVEMQYFKEGFNLFISFTISMHYPYKGNAFALYYFLNSNTLRWVHLIYYINGCIHDEGTKKE